MRKEGLFPLFLNAETHLNPMLAPAFRFPGKMELGRHGYMIGFGFPFIQWNVILITDLGSRQKALGSLDGEANALAADDDFLAASLRAG